MSAETDFRALLAGHAGTAALVGRAIAHNAISSGTPAPYVVFTCQHDLEIGLSGVLLADQCTFTLQCWGNTAAQAETVADACEAAIATASQARAAAVTARASGYDEETGLDATVLTVEWWS
jgi:hypothetical protein